MPRTTRPHLIVSGFVAVVLIALIAVPTALGAKPTRMMFTPEDIFIPAGMGCAFGVQETVSEDTRATITEFTDGRVVIHGHSNPTLTNVDTGATFVQKTRAHVTDYGFDPEANTFFEKIDGRIFVSFFPGDQGPFGVVEEPGLLLSVIGHQRITADADTGFFTSYSLNGQATDICAQID